MPTPQSIFRLFFSLSLTAVPLSDCLSSFNQSTLFLSLSRLEKEWIPLSKVSLLSRKLLTGTMSLPFLLFQLVRVKTDLDTVGLDCLTGWVSLVQFSLYCILGFFCFLLFVSLELRGEYLEVISLLILILASDDETLIRFTWWHVFEWK